MRTLIHLEAHRAEERCRLQPGGADLRASDLKMFEGERLGDNIELVLEPAQPLVLRLRRRRQERRSSGRSREVLGDEAGRHP